MPITLEKLSYKLDLKKELEKVPENKRREVSKKVGDILKEGILDYTSRGITPVSGGEYKKSLSKNYKKFKVAEGGKPYSDLRLDNDMLNSINVIPSKDKVTLKIQKELEIKKGYNHNTGDTLPVRQFMPDDESDEVFKRPIISKVKELIRSYEEEKPNSSKRTVGDIRDAIESLDLEGI